MLIVARGTSRLGVDEPMRLISLVTVAVKAVLALFNMFDPSVLTVRTRDGRLLPCAIVTP